MDPADINQYVEQALACLMDGAHNQAMRSSKSDGSGERQRLLKMHDFLQLSYKALIADTARSLNSLAPIHRLPNELLVKIIALIPAVDGFHPCQLRLVSKDWSRVISETPSLWAQISSSHSDRENRAAILRSKDYPLRIDYGDRRGGTAFIDLCPCWKS
ncbi:hypothetical protein FRB95_009797 [Tulasnella sp. JGI-2019a]|nr:hypothetical protein FRB93_006578 [Tulasnella sp. JGI-2019a]KAG9025771.1 hypothetical protein FRB95_009797 [Tulasnella sp. JGI-2019a]